MIRVLVVEDSASMRRYLRESIAADPELVIVGEAVDGAQAVRLCGQLRPDVVTMDMMLPRMSGLAAIAHIMAEFPTPILVVTVANRPAVFSTYDALAAGAVDVLEKPRGDGSDGDWAGQLCAALRLVSRIRVISRPRTRLGGHPPGSAPAAPDGPEAPPGPDGGLRVVAIGASTGGPRALTDLVRSLPAAFRTPLLCVQHIPASEPFSVAFSDWLADQAGRPVTNAADGTVVDELAGAVVLAPPDRHVYVRHGRVRLSDGPPRHSCRPSVDVLFESVADEYGPLAAGCLLTGIGRDGAEGLLRMRARGAVTFAQDEASSAVYGMPHAAALLGAATHILPPREIAGRLAALHRPSGVRP
jgi:two-component system chemotaxis response regulator CheB